MAKKPTKQRQTTFWVSKDLIGPENHLCALWRDEPVITAGWYESDKGPVERYGDDCEAFLDFCKAIDVEPPKKGQLIQLTIKAETIARGTSHVELAKKLRTAKTYDKSLLDDAASWLEAMTEDDQGVYVVE